MQANPNYTHLEKHVSIDRITLLQGGTRSGKTYAVIDWIINHCLKHEDVGLEIDIVRDTFTALKATAWKDFENRLIEFGLYDHTQHNKTDHSYRLSGNTINYYGCDTPEKIHGRSRDLLWINEAHQFPQEIIDQLFPRTRYRIIADYNPALPTEHWLDKYIQQYPPCITTYKDNPHLTQDQIDDIESRRGDGTGYWWSVYGNGHRMRLQGLVFPNWERGKFPEHLPYIFGQDYGFNPDPTTLVKVAVDEKAKVIYAKYCYHGNKLSTDEIFERNNQITGGKQIIADGAEKRLINELFMRGQNIREAIKGPGSVVDGLRTMSGYRIVIEDTSDDKVIQREFDNYAWHDKKSETPIDAWNHFIDSIRYAAMNLIESNNRGSATTVNNIKKVKVIKPRRASRIYKL
jgi:phage terminase large subunit